MIIPAIVGAMLLLDPLQISWDAPPGLDLSALRVTKSKGPLPGTTWTKGCRDVVWVYDSPLATKEAEQALEAVVGSKMNSDGVFSKTLQDRRPGMVLTVRVSTVVPAGPSNGSLSNGRTEHAELVVTARPLGDPESAALWPPFARRQVLSRMPSWMSRPYYGKGPESVVLSPNSAVGSFTAFATYRLDKPMPSARAAWTYVFGSSFAPPAGADFSVENPADAPNGLVVVKIPVFGEDIDKDTYLGP
ncbi:MAG: hypothetical protein JSS66_18260 [Armatimonadetes bacterium]|nr:hypothetical protein [Armatimonadota bacterium]